jgi:hypothetical protein
MADKTPEELRQELLARLAEVEVAMAALPPSQPGDPLTKEEMEEVTKQLEIIKRMAVKAAPDTAG